MAIRREAMGGAAFCRLKEAYDGRKAVLRRWKSGGKKVVGLMGYDIPEEILLAAGLLPFRITGYYGGERASAEKYLEYSFGSVWKGLWESLTSDYEGLIERVVFCSSSDMFLKLFYYLRALGGLEPERRLPEMLYLDFELTQKTFKTQERNERELRDLIAAAERWSGNAVSAQDLRAAIALCSEYRRALRAFNALRGPERCTVTGSEALTVIGGSMFMEKREATDCLRRVTEEARKWPDAPGVRVYYAGSVQETTEVYELAEQAGLSFEITTGHLEDAHPNTAQITLYGEDSQVSVQGASVGGGNILINRINGMAVEISGQFTTLIVLHRDAPGTIAHVTELLGSNGINIANFRLAREQKGGTAVMTIEIDGDAGKELNRQVAALENVLGSTMLKPI